MLANTFGSSFKRKVAAIILMTAGWGWIDGNFVPDDQFYIYNALIHCIPIALLLILSVGFFRTPDDSPSRPNPTWANTGLTIFAIATIIGNIVMIILGASNQDPNAVGVKTLPDWFTVVLVNLGTFLWLSTLIPFHRRGTRPETGAQESKA